MWDSAAKALQWIIDTLRHRFGSTIERSPTPMARENIHHKLEPLRANRPHLTYEVQIDDAIVMKSLPFVVGVLADLSGMPDEPLRPLRERNFIEVDRDNFQAVLAAMKPRLVCRVDNELRQDGSSLNVELRFSCMDDFWPDRVARGIEPLRRLLEARQWLDSILSRFEPTSRPELVLNRIERESGKPEPEPEGDHPSPIRSAPGPPASDPRWDPNAVPGLLDLIFDQGGATFDDDSGRRLLELMDITAADLASITAAPWPRDGATGASRDVLEAVRSFLRRIDDGLSRQLDAILHHPEFQRLEATWRGRTTWSSSRRPTRC